MTEKLVYSVTEVAGILGVCAQTVRNLCAEGRLLYIKVGAKRDRVIIPAKSISEFLGSASKEGGVNEADTVWAL